MSFASLRRVLRAARKGLCATCSKTRYPQLEAAGAGHVGCLIYTLETIGGLIRDEHDVTAMHVAARKGQISILIYLVENNTIDKKDIPRARNGATPAHDAAGTGNLECLRYLLNCTIASPTDLDINSATPLHWASQSGHLQVVQWLVIDAKAPIDVVAKNGVTPFHLAAAKNHLEVLRWMVAYAFRTHPHPLKLINAKDKNESTPVYHAAHAGNIEVVKWLTEKGGGDPTVVNRQGLAPLHAATSNGHVECVKFLFRFGLGTAPGGLRTTEGACALHFAAAEGHNEIIRWLLQQNECSGNERDHFQSTPLHDAAENGNLIVLKTLCDHGCDPALVDIDGNKPIDLSRKNGHPKCVAYLDNHMKRLLWSKMNGTVIPEVRASKKIQRNKLQKSQIMDKLRNAPPHMMPVSAFEDNDDALDLVMKDSKQMLDQENEWVTVRDLLKEDEIKKMSENQEYSSSPARIQRMSEAELKRRLFEEKLAKEQEERQQMKLMAIKQKEEEEEEIRHQFVKGDGVDDDDVLEALKSFDDILQEEQKSLAHKLSTKDKDHYPSQNLKIGQQLEDGMERRGSKWISKILRKRASSLDSATNMPVRKPHRRGSDPSEWNISTPPPLPKLKYLMGKHKHAQSLSNKKEGKKKEEKKDVMTSKWGREAYDDNEEESDEGSISGSMENLSHLKIKQKQSGQKQATHHSQVQDTPSKSTERTQPKKTMVRKVTPRPKVMPDVTSRESKPIPFHMDDDNSLNGVKVMKKSTTDKGEQQQNAKSQAAAPIGKVASARSKVNKPSSQHPLYVQAQAKPSAIHNSPPSTLGGPMFTKGQQQTEGKMQMPPAVNRQSSINEKELMKGEEENDDDDDDADDDASSSEEESSEYESSESSDTDDDDDDDRPIMAQNMGIHGAKIAKQVMQRMKNQRYPSIFSKPIIKLDTIMDVRYEAPYQTDSKRGRANALKRLHAEKKVWDSWRKHVQIIRLARKLAEKMLQRRKKAMVAEVFYAWVQAKNEAEVEKAERKQKALKHYKLKMKAKAFCKWKVFVMQENERKNPKHVHQKYLKWLNTQLAALGRKQVNDLFKPLENGTIIIAIIVRLSEKKPPRYKSAPKLKLHYLDNWKVAHQFMKSVGVTVRDFEPAGIEFHSYIFSPSKQHFLFLLHYTDLAILHEPSILNMFSSILKWADR